MEVGLPVRAWGDERRRFLAFFCQFFFLLQFTYSFVSPNSVHCTSEIWWHKEFITSEDFSERIVSIFSVQTSKDLGKQLFLMNIFYLIFFSFPPKRQS